MSSAFDYEKNEPNRMECAFEIVIAAQEVISNLEVSKEKVSIFL